MYIPPWLLAFVVLVMVCAMGVSVIKSFRKFPEGFDDVEKEEDVKEEDGYINSPPQPPIVDAPEPIPIAGAAYVSANSPDGPEFESYLQQIKSRVGTSSTVPTQANLDMISGGPEAPVSEAQVQGYLPNQERILPHQMPPERKPAMIANVSQDAGTGAENIQNGATAVRSLRENVRDDGVRAQGFQSDATIQYTRA
jgi:hypothetical protein